MRQIGSTAAISLFIIGAVFAPARAAERVESIPTRDGVTQGYWLVEPEGAPRAIAIMILGGDGVLRFDENGPTSQKNNFLMRVRGDMLRAGMLLAYPDTPSDQNSGLDNFRSDPRHAEDIKALILALKSRADVPAFVIGTSRGTVSAANAAARLDPSVLAGALLTTTIFDRTVGRVRLTSVHNVPLAEIRVPVLELHHRDDQCYITQVAGVPAFMRALTNAPRKDSVILSGGRPAESEPCGALAPHGFFGVQDQAVQAMTDWIDSVLAGG
jgi:hypothetical protein